MPEDGYGWEKLFSERMCRHFREDFGLATRVARYHNVYGPYGTYDGGREKAPAAICRKVAQAKLSGTHDIEIWGDGEQTRSFMYIDDCVHGTQLLTSSDVTEPLNIGSSELVTINQLVVIVEEIAGIDVERRYKLDAPQGVRGRNSDNTLILERLGWEPSITSARRHGARPTAGSTTRWSRPAATTRSPPPQRADTGGSHKPRVALSRSAGGSGGQWVPPRPRPNDGERPCGEGSLCAWRSASR